MQAIDRVISVLESLTPTAKQYEFSLAEVARATNMSHATVRRLLKALEQHRWVAYSALSGRYQLGEGLIQFSTSIWQRAQLQSVSREIIQDAVEQTGETAYLAIRAGDYGIFIEKVESESPLQVNWPLGVRLPLSTGASKRAILAFLPPEEREGVLHRLKDRYPDLHLDELRNDLQTIRDRGYAISDNPAAFIGGVAAPIFDENAAVSAAISLSGTRPPDDPDKVNRAIEAVLAAAQAISTALGYYHRSPDTRP